MLSLANIHCFALSVTWSALVSSFTRPPKWLFFQEPLSYNKLLVLLQSYWGRAASLQEMLILIASFTVWLDQSVASFMLPFVDIDWVTLFCLPQLLLSELIRLVRSFITIKYLTQHQPRYLAAMSWDNQISPQTPLPAHIWGFWISWYAHTWTLPPFAEIFDSTICSGIHHSLNWLACK